MRDEREAKFFLGRVDKEGAMQGDQTIAWSGSIPQRLSARLRRIRYWDAHGESGWCSHNNFTLPAHVIAELYRRRWHVELFFQMDQAASADQGFLWHFGERRQDPGLDRICSYLLVAIVRKRLNCA